MEYWFVIIEGNNENLKTCLVEASELEVINDALSNGKSFQFTYIPNPMRLNEKQKYWIKYQPLISVCFRPENYHPLSS